MEEFVYTTTFLSLQILDIQYLHESIRFELRIGNKLCNFVALYRSPSQTEEKFEIFSDNFELNLGNLSHKNTFLVVANRDINAKSKCWYFNDSTTSHGNLLFRQFELQQILEKPTHILDHSSSCIDLIFTLKSNVMTES